MKVEIYSRQAIKELMAKEFPKNTAVISFCSPRKIRRTEEARVYFTNVCDRVFSIMIPDIDIEILGDYGYTYDSYLAEADQLAQFIYEVRAEGRDIICQCDFGQSRSAACAAAILQHFEGRGIDIFSDYRYYPNQLVYHKIFDALQRMTSRAVTIHGSVWCDLKVENNTCLYRFFPSNIPQEYGGCPNGDLIEGTIHCHSNEAATSYLDALASLVESGHHSPLNWQVALDMGDLLTHVFNGAPLQYSHQTIADTENQTFGQDFGGADAIFAYFNLPNAPASVAYYDAAVEQISSVSNAAAEVWTQLAFRSSPPYTIDIWYR